MAHSGPAKSNREGMTLIQVMDEFPTDKAGPEMV